MKFIRVHKTCRHKFPENTVYVGRGKGKFSHWSNPEKLEDKENLEERIANLKRYETNIRAKIKSGELNPDELRNKNLACWCPLDKPCHVDIIFKILNEPKP